MSPGTRMPSPTCQTAAYPAVPPPVFARIPPVQVFVPLGVITGVPGVTWEKFIFNNLIPGARLRLCLCMICGCFGCRARQPCASCSRSEPAH